MSGVLRERARGFLTAAHATLTELHVLPVPRYQVPLRVGSDYFGPDLMGPAYAQLEQQLQADFAARFPPPGSDNFESAVNWIFALLEAAITAEVRGGLSWPTACTTAIRQWNASLGRSEHHCVAVRLVRHVATPGGTTVRVGAVTVTPTVYQPGPELEGTLPGAFRLVFEAEPGGFAPPYALATARASHADAHTAVALARSQIGRFVSAARLATCATVSSEWEVTGERGPVQYLSTLFVPLARDREVVTGRLCTLEPGVVRAIRAATTLVDTSSALPRAGDDRPSPVGVAMSRFARSFDSPIWYDALMDAAIGCEAALSCKDDDAEGVSLRLRLRAAHLLSTADEPAQNIFGDVRVLYGLRSRIAHGDDVALPKLLREAGKLSRLKDGLMPNPKMHAAADRLRDLLRRAIIARLVMADLPGGWPDKGGDLDQALSDTAWAQKWRRSWQAELGRRKVGMLGRPAELLQDSFSVGH
jgi:hypothetical protein